PGPPPQEPIEPQRAEGGSQERAQPRRPRIDTERAQGGCRQPVEERWLVKIGKRIERRPQPVPRPQHLQSYSDVATLIGQGKRPQPGQSGEPNEHGKAQWRGAGGCRTQRLQSQEGIDEAMAHADPRERFLNAFYSRTVAGSTCDSLTAGSAIPRICSR